MWYPVWALIVVVGVAPPLLIPSSFGCAHEPAFAGSRHQVAVADVEYLQLNHQGPDDFDGVALCIPC